MDSKLTLVCSVLLVRKPNRAGRARQKSGQKMSEMYNCTAIFTRCGARHVQLNILVRKNIWFSSRRVLLQLAQSACNDVCHCAELAMCANKCPYPAQARVARSARAIRVGSLRPAIVLYEESHPLGDDIGAIHTADLARKPDMLVIMGTSLKVHGLKKLVKDFARTVHSTSSSAVSCSKKPYKVLFVNKTPPAAEWSDIIDYHISSETDLWSNKVIEDWKKMRPADWEIQQTLVGEGEPLAGGLKAVKSLVKSSTAKPRNPRAERENIHPIPSEPATKSTAGETKLAPPLSPSKRRQKSSHYDDLESSPSKRQTTSEHYRAMPASERRMLFTEKTNQRTASAKDDVETSKVDMSLCDLSLPDVKGPDTSKMDISLLELSMIDVEPPTEEKLVKPPKRARNRVPDQKKPTTKMATRPKKLALRTDPC